MSSTYYILGSGPVGVIVASYLLEKGNNVELIDNSGIQKSITKDIPKKFTYKKINKQIFSEFFQTIDDNRNVVLPVSSRTVGGFTEVWGGTLNNYDNLDFLNWPVNNKDLINEYLYLKKTITLMFDLDESCNITTLQEEYDDLTNNIYNFLSRNSKKLNNNNLFFKKSILFLKNGKTWSSSELLILLKERFPNNLNHITNFETIELFEEGEEIRLLSEKEEIKINNKKLFVATGYFSSAYLATSLLNKNKFNIKDSELRVVPFIWLGKSSKNKNSSTHPQLFFDIKNDNKKTIRTQLYSLNSEVISSIGENNIFYKILLTFFNKLLANRLYLNFIYSHSNVSDNYDFQMKNNKIHILNKTKVKNYDGLKVIGVFLRNFFLTFLLPLPAIKKFPPYGSFHSGACSFINSSDGRTSDKSNIHFIDSSVFKDIPSGPITFTSMSVGLKIVKDAIK